VIRYAGRRTAAAVGEYGSALSRRISIALLGVLTALWLSGSYWLLLHYVWARPGEFGVIRHPLEAPTLLVHGVIAMAALFLLGWFAGRHAGAASSGRRVASGWLLTLLTAVLVMAGCAQLFLTSAVWQEALAVVHEVIGAALPIPVLVHGWRASAASRDRGRADAHSRAHAPRHGGRHPPRSARS
jgi:hypothetical protein